MEGPTVSEVLRRAECGEYRPAREVNPSVPPALAAICARAMALAPADRYGSARDLAEEVERFLADEPVRAYRDSWPTRLGRWSRRHRGLASGAVALLLAGVAGLGLGLWAVGAEQRRTAQERDLAEANLALARQAVDECFLIAKEHPLLQQEELRQVRKLLLEKALPFYRQFKERRPDDPAVQEDLAAISFRLGFISNELGSPSEARAAYTTARELYERLAKWHPDVASYQARLGEADVASSGALWNAGDPEGALQFAQEALGILGPANRQHPDDVEIRALLAKAHGMLAMVHWRRGTTPRGFDRPTKHCSSIPTWPKGIPTPLSTRKTWHPPATCSAS
jgi:serine/threonine-protein kinase